MLKLVSLLSGGLDSCVALAIAKQQLEPDEIYCMSVSYGQRHVKELDAAQKIATHYSAKEFKLVDIPLFQLGGSSLVGDGEIQDYIENRDKGLPSTFVPGRNMIMLAFAFGYAYHVDASWIVGGWNVLDYSGYPDCRPEFLEAVEEAGKLAVDRDIRITAPLVKRDKKTIILEGESLEAPLHLTWSCYRGGEVPCGTCDSCHYRQEGFKAAGIKDPALED